MFIPFFENLRSAKIPVSLREYLSFLKATKTGMVLYDIEGFYFLARTAMVKDERNLDKFDQVFSSTFKRSITISISCVLYRSNRYPLLTSTTLPSTRALIKPIRVICSNNSL